MPITVTCPACQNTLKVKDEYAGKKGKCPKCQALMPIPGPAPASSSQIGGGKVPGHRCQAGRSEAARNAAAATGAALRPKVPDEIRELVLAAFQGTCQPPVVSFAPSWEPSSF